MSKIITEYKVIYSTLFDCYPKPLSQEVAEMLADGWQPLGAAVPLENNKCIRLFQTMVKYEEVYNETASN